jgi:hypothetical protein
MSKTFTTDKPIAKDLATSFGRFAGLALLGFLLALSMVPGAVADSGSRSFEFSYVVKLDPPAGSHKIHGRIRLPSTDYFQTISQMQLQAPDGIRIHRESQGGDSFASFSGDSSRVSGPIEIRVTFHVVRYEQRPDLAAAANAAGSPSKPAGASLKESAAFLAQPSRSDTLNGADGLLARSSETRTRDATDPVVKVHEIYDEVVSETGADRIDANASSASAISCSSYNDDCEGMNSRFVRLVRAAGIPARLKIGFSLPSGQNEGTIHSYHGWAEFYISGMGWIPVDVSRALQEPDKRDDFFGKVDTRCVMISSGRDANSTAATGAAETPGEFDALVNPQIDVDGKAYAKYSEDFFFAEPGIDTTRISKKPIYADGSFRDGIQSLRLPS